MRDGRAGLRAGALAAALALALAGCGVSEPAIEQMTAEEIFAQAERELATRPRRDRAAQLFAEVERLYPYSGWARRALVMQAYALHRRRAFEEARGAAQRFLDLYPEDPEAPYAAYLLALSYYDQIEDVGRDQGVTRAALQALRTVIERYPDSEFARSSQLKFDLAFDHLAGKEMEVGRFYLRRGHHTAAVNRFRVVVEQFQTTTHTAEALHRLVEAYLALGLTDEARTAGAILGHNYRASPFYEDSFRLLDERGLTPEPQGTGWLAAIWRQVIRGEWI